jgi:CBS domain-containing protein
MYSFGFAGSAMLTVEQALKSERLAGLRLSDPPCVPPGTRLGEALAIMRRQGAGCILVCEGERLAGIFTERDVLNKLFADRPVGEDEPVDGYMTRDPETLLTTDTLADAIRLMTRGGLRHVPVIEAGGRRVGLVAARDIVRYIAEHFPAEVMNLPALLQQNFLTPEGA